MKAQYVGELSDGMRVDAIFAVRDCGLRLSRAGRPYVSLELADRTGVVPGVMFGPPTAEPPVSTGQVARVRGRTESYRGVRRIVVQELSATDEYDRGDLIPTGRRDTGELLGYLEYLAGEIFDPGLRRLALEALSDGGNMERLSMCPGSQSQHHAYIGGLLEHTVSVATLCQHVGQSYEFVDADLLLAGALLHDIGKLDELAYDTSIAYTDEGRLLGHVILGERRVRQAATRLRGAVDGPTLLRLCHVLVSHHGELEWGSPKRPAMLEAIILHHVDNLDAKVAGFMDAVSGAVLAEERWTDVKNLFRRPLYAPRAIEDDRLGPPAEDEQYRPAVPA